MKVLLLNGPPKSGKDTIGGMLMDHIPGSETFKFSYELKRMTHRAFGFPDKPDAFEAIKDDLDQGPEAGVSWRQAYIAMSEKFCKPLFGAGYFGKLLHYELRSQDKASLAVVTDSGFREEAEALKEKGHDLFLLRIYRDGCTFVGDSRSYWNADHIVTDSASIYNNGTLEDLSAKVATFAALPSFRAWLGGA